MCDLPSHLRYYANWCQLVLAVVEILVTKKKVDRAKEKASASMASASGPETQRKAVLVARLMF